MSYPQIAAYASQLERGALFATADQAARHDRDVAAKRISHRSEEQWRVALLFGDRAIVDELRWIAEAIESASAPPATRSFR